VPPADAQVLLKRGVARVFTPKDYELTEIMNEIVDVVRAANGLARTGR
jgi:(2R)-ethylmalonyl-CoA mutase